MSSRMREPGAPGRFLRPGPITGAVAAAFLLGVVGYVSGRSHFLQDDIYHFVLARELGFFAFLFEPIDVHLVPMHRLATYTIFSLFPFNVTVALAVLAIFYAGSLYLLYRVLLLLGDIPVNWILLLLASTSILLIDQFAWWSSGIHRLPYVLLATACLYVFLRYRKEGGWTRLLALAALQILGIGFYVKAVLVPLYLLALETALTAGERRVSDVGRVGMALAVTGGVSLAYVMWYLIGSPGPGFRPELSGFFVTAREMFLVAYHAVLGIRYAGAFTAVHGVITLFWAGFIAYTVARAPRNVIPWLAFATVLFANFAMIALSDRIAIYGSFIATGIPRYYFEVFFLFAVFLAIIWRNAERGSGSAGETVPLPNRRGSPFMPVLFLIFALSYSAYAFNGTVRHFRDHYAEYHLGAARYLDNLLDDLDRLDAGRTGEEQIWFLDGTVSRWVFDPFGFRMPVSALVPLVLDGIAFDRVAPHLYAVEEDTGRVESLEPLIEDRFPLDPATSRWPDGTEWEAGRCLPLASGETEVHFQPPGWLVGHRALLMLDYRADVPIEAQVSMSRISVHEDVEWLHRRVSLVPSAPPGAVDLGVVTAGDHVRRISVALPPDYAGLCVTEISVVPLRAGLRPGDLVLGR